MSFPGPLVVNTRTVTYPTFFLGISTAYYVVFFGFVRLFDRKGLWANDGEYGYIHEPVHPDVGMIVLVAVAIYVAMFLVARRATGAFAPDVRVTISPPVAIYGAAIVILVAHMAMTVFEVRPSVLYQAVSNLKFFCILAIRFAQINNPPKAPLYWLGTAAIVSLLLVEASDMLLTAVIMSILCLFFVEILHGRRSWIAFLFLGVVAVGLYPIKRTPVPPSVAMECPEGNERRGVAYLPEVWASCSGSRLNFAAAALKWSIRPLVSRMSTDKLFDRVYKRTPETVPYWGGRTLHPLSYALVPRFLMSDKPVENIGQVFGHAYKILLPSDVKTSVNIPWIVELYANYSTKGVIFGMAIFGAVLGFLTTLGTMVRGRGEITVLVMGVTFPFLYPESNISLMFGNAAHGAVGGVLIIVLLRAAARWRAANVA